MIVQELFDYKRVSVNGDTVLFVGTGQLAGFLCTSAGTVQIKDKDGTDIVSVLNVVSGQFVPMPFSCGNGATVALGGGCVGTLAIGK
jgi:hypothetical protein